MSGGNGGKGGEGGTLRLSMSVTYTEEMSDMEMSELVYDWMDMELSSLRYQLYVKGKGNDKDKDGGKGVKGKGNDKDKDGEYVYANNDGSGDSVMVARAGLLPGTFIVGEGWVGKGSGSSFCGKGNEAIVGGKGSGKGTDKDGKGGKGTGKYGKGVVNPFVGTFERWMF